MSYQHPKSNVHPMDVLYKKMNVRWTSIGCPCAVWGCLLGRRVRDEDDPLTWCVYYLVTAVSWTPDCPWRATRWGTTDRSRFVAHSSWPSHETIHLGNSSARAPYRTPCATSARLTWKTQRTGNARKNGAYRGTVGRQLERSRSQGSFNFINNFAPRLMLLGYFWTKNLISNFPF